MDSNVFITVKTGIMPELGRGEPDYSVVETEGRLTLTEDGCVLEYDMDADGDPNGKIKIVLKGESFNFIRMGEYSADFLVETGVKSRTMYRMPFGHIMVGVFGIDIESDITGDSGSITVRYEIDFNSAMAAQYVMDISYRRI